ncbi:MAG: hypothetical protein HQ549_00340 [Candidatus Omnitrophica bacterium]|nr:hypothetical protein [Candidatus Omnitrophota bacterium]
MVMVVRLFGVIIMVIGILFLVRKNTLKGYIAFWRNEKRLKVGGILALLFGIVFLIAAPQCRIVLLIKVLGIWSIIKGVLLLVIKPKSIYTYLDWWQGKPILSMRLISLLALAFGALLVYSA